MKFIDEVTIDVSSGHGGPGHVSFMSQSYMPKMGPDGGDGGKGGDVYFVATHNQQSLLDFKYKTSYDAPNGNPGEIRDCNGRAGGDLVIQVPVGTTLVDAESGEFLADLVEPDKKILLLKGGRGGLGNMNFATAKRQAPDFAQPGEPGQARKIRLELKLLADVALVGFPNAGKSTLISRLSSAKPKIADYPFTTLVPNLGVVRGDNMDFVLADIPGLIEGASDGKGLGHKFLRHVERTRFLIILLDLNPDHGRTLSEEFNILRQEMIKFSPELENKEFLVAFNKCDAFGSSKDALFKEFLKERGFDELSKEIKKTKAHKGTYYISAVSGEGLEELKKATDQELKKLGPRVFKNDLSQEVMLGNAALFEGNNKSDE